MAKNQNPEISDDQIPSVLAPFVVHLSSEQVAKVGEYTRILLKWNKLISLTSVIDPAEIVARHFGESMYLSELMPVENCRLADVGSGAGFPGLALKILRPNLDVTLIESNKKKCAFLAEVVRILGLHQVEIINERFQDIRVENNFADSITARALGCFSDLLRWSKNALPSRGHIALWVGGEDATKVMTTPGWTWLPAVRIPDSQRRFILTGRPLK